ncbi:Multiple sugar ABC transporter, substrate-binding protein [Alkalibacterium sp. AK22]|uniref:ABC transporter substrate-binding protein n=1 Tax=Alkalibacterium sp. AK22 TaxID=1229520 RepID=UPI0004508995|nr:ABC transporter substrate-binding protein [Alkalibacterium sp. AK22]EXJ23737.1 Multiple sugar ABC transporter, substrate-binding protein [Alkalibacterium sp. AK22]
MFKRNYFYKGLLLFSAAGLLAACGNEGDIPGTDGGNGNGDDGNGNGASGEDISLTIMQGKVEFNSQFNDLAQMYMDENPNISIDITSVGGGTDYFTQLTTRFSAGDEPDIFSVAGPNEFEQMAEYLSDLSDTEAAAAALEGTLDDVTEDDGTVTALPYNLEGYGFIYNKDVFEAAGIDAEEISTYEDLEEAVQTIDGNLDELDIQAVFAFPGAEAWVPGNHLSNVFLAHEFDESVNEAYAADTVTFERGDEFQRMLDLQVDYSIEPVLSLDYSQQVEEYFSLGQVAIIQQGNWVYPTLEQMDPDFAENSVGMIPIPLEGHENHLPVGIPNYWGVNSNSDDATVQAAKDFLDWMYLSDEGKDFVINEFNFIPSYEGYEDMDIADPLSQIVYDYSERGETIGWVFNGYPTGWTNNEFGPNIQAYIGGEMSWDEMIDNSISAWESLQ